MARYIGVDRKGHERVFGEAKQPDVAFTECRQAVIEYVRRRPDAGPVSAWLIERADRS